MSNPPPALRLSADTRYLIILPGVEAGFFKLDSPVVDVAATFALALASDGSQRFVVKPVPPGPGGDVTGPGFSADNAVARFDGVTGKIIQNSLAVLDDAGTLSLPAGSAASPTFTFSGQPSSGVYFSAGGGVAVASGGADRFFAYHQKTGLANGAPNDLITVAGLGANPRAGLHVTFLIEAADGGGINQAVFGRLLLVAQQTAGVVTGLVSVTSSSTVGAGTITASWGVATGVVGQATLRLTPTSSLAPTTLRVSMQVQAVNAAVNTVTFV